MSAGDAVSSTTPVEPPEIDPLVSLHATLDDFAPENPSAQGPRPDVSPADQFVREIRARTAAIRARTAAISAAAVRVSPALFARIVDALRPHGRLIVALGGVAGAVLGATVAMSMSFGPSQIPSPAQIAARLSQIAARLSSSLNLRTDAGDSVLDAPKALPRSQERSKRAQPPVPPGAGRPSTSDGRLTTRPAGSAQTVAPVFGSAGLGPGTPGTGTNGAQSARPTVSPATPSAAVRQAEDAEGIVYSSEDGDVLPAQLLTAQLPGPTVAGAPTRIILMEVIVSEHGTVERARLVSPARRMPDMMILSSAKVWTFSPALKDGRPVRYRLVLSWETSP